MSPRCPEENPEVSGSHQRKQLAWKDISVLEGLKSLQIDSMHVIHVVIRSWGSVWHATADINLPNFSVACLFKTRRTCGLLFICLFVFQICRFFKYFFQLDVLCPLWRSSSWAWFFSLFFIRKFHIELCHSRPTTYLQHLKKTAIFVYDIQGSLPNKTLKYAISCTHLYCHIFSHKL